MTSSKLALPVVFVAEMITDFKGRPIHQSDQAVLVADDAGRYVDANLAALELLGYRLDELLDKTIWDITPPELKEEGMLQFTEMAERGEDAGRWVVMKKDGEWLEIFYIAVADAEPGRHVSNIWPVPPEKQLRLRPGSKR